MTLRILQRSPHPHGVRFACAVCGSVTFLYCPLLRKRNSLECFSDNRFLTDEHGLAALG